MARPPALTPDQLDAAMAGLPDWSVRDGMLHAEFVFADFALAFGFMAAVATEAARLDHHPEWTNVYKTVTVVLSSHDADGVTERDIRLAEAMDRIAAT